MNLLTASVSPSFLLPRLLSAPPTTRSLLPPLLASLPPTPRSHTHTPSSTPQCVWLVAQTLGIRIALQCSSEEGEGEEGRWGGGVKKKRAYISNLCRALLFSARTQRNGSPASSQSRANRNVMKRLPATQPQCNLHFPHRFSLSEKHCFFF